MSNRSKTEYQVLAGWATSTENICTFNDFCDWLIRAKDIKNSEIHEDYDIIKECFSVARGCRCHEYIDAIKFFAVCLKNRCDIALSQELLSSDDINGIIEKFGLKRI